MLQFAGLAALLNTVLPEDTNWKELIDGTNVAGRDNKTEKRE